MRSEDGRDTQTYAIIGAAMEAHNQLGHGFLEAVYQWYLSLRGAEGFARQSPATKQSALPSR